MAGRKCNVCKHPHSRAIEDYARGRTPGEVAKRFPGVSRDSVRSHLRDHVFRGSPPVRELAQVRRPAIPAPPQNHPPEASIRIRLERDRVQSARWIDSADDVAADRETLQALRVLIGAPEERVVSPDPALGAFFAFCDVLRIGEDLIPIPGVSDEAFLDDVSWTLGLLRRTFAPLAEARYGPAGLEALVADTVQELELRIAYAEARLRYLERPVSTWEAPPALLLT